MKKCIKNNSVKITKKIFLMCFFIAISSMFVIRTLQDIKDNVDIKNHEVTMVKKSVFARPADIKMLKPIRAEAEIGSTLDIDLTGMIVIEEEETVSTVVRNEEIIYADATMYDYYSDSQIGAGATPGAITDARYSGYHGHFNRTLLSTMKYGIPSRTPTRYPMYLGNFLKTSSGPSYDGILYSTEEACATSNFWRSSNTGVYSTVATPGLIDNRLTYEGGESYITTSNPDNGRSAKVPYFDKSYLEGTRIKSGSRLSMGEVIEDLQFPFRKTVEDGVPYYIFDSRIDVARFTTSNKLEYIGTDPAQLVYDNGGGPSFLPFDTAGTSLFNLNLCFGMKIEIPFYMTESGTIDGKDIVFEFSGDDDVWIFVDNELILDIGGCHRRVAGKINFRTQMGTVEGSFNPRVAFSKRLLFIDASLTQWTDPAAGLYNETIAFYNKNTHFSNALKNSFTDTTREHKITVFYMERAKGASNLYMKFNLLTDQSYKKTSGVYNLFGMY